MHGKRIWRNTLKHSRDISRRQARFSSMSERRPHPHQYPSTSSIKRVSLVPVWKPPACISTHPFHTNLSIVYASTAIPPFHEDDSLASRLEVKRILETKRVEIYFETSTDDSINLFHSEHAYKDVFELVWLIASYPRNSRVKRPLRASILESRICIMPFLPSLAFPPEILFPGTFFLRPGCVACSPGERAANSLMASSNVPSWYGGTLAVEIFRYASRAPEGAVYSP